MAEAEANNSGPFFFLEKLYGVITRILCSFDLLIWNLILYAPGRIYFRLKTFYMIC